ncbi:MAG TPA: M28 family peptidase [Pyrinomonadaceae bacterium]|jgi:Zn-dependent M28 family amino/carboxypeptidase|nr:M28 family peptidase [Pyrinomonadaceae bacterium]
MKKITAFLMIITLGVLPMLAQTMAQDNTKLFDAAKMKARVVKLSSDEFAGRGPGTAEGKAAAQYIADELKAMGVRPANNGSYFQNVKLFSIKTDPGTTLSISGGSGKDGAATYKFADEFVAFTGAQKADVSVDAELVFAGYGIKSDLYKWNDYKGSPDQYKGKVLMILVNDPPAPANEPDLFTGKALTYNGRWMYKFEEAARRGAAGVILVHTTESAGYGWNVVRTSNGSWRYDIAREPGDKSPYLDLKAWATEETSKKILGQAGLKLSDLQEKAKTRDFTPVKTGLRVKCNLKAETNTVDSPNVVGVIPGVDIKLSKEYVIYSAHWDHLGVGAPNAKGDKIYNGALDNASGCSAVLGIAEALMKIPKVNRPRRSILFLFPTAEEQGLLGAEYYAHHPLVPLDKTAGNVNIDGLNIFSKTSDFVALGAERSSLLDIVADVAKERSMTVSGDAHPEQGSFYRSDHFPFAKVGVPSISLKEGNKFIDKPADYGDKVFDEFNTKNYHQPSDEFGEWWNFESMIQECEIGLAIGLKIANTSVMPRFKTTDEFSAPDKVRMGGK